MTTPYISSGTRALAAKLGYNIAANTLTVARPRGWPTKSAKPIHLKRAIDGGHVASFADVFQLIRYLKARRA